MGKQGRRACRDNSTHADLIIRYSKSRKVSHKMQIYFASKIKPVSHHLCVVRSHIWRASLAFNSIQRITEYTTKQRQSSSSDLNLTLNRKFRAATSSQILLFQQFREVKISRSRRLQMRIAVMKKMSGEKRGRCDKSQHPLMTI